VSEPYLSEIRIMAFNYPPRNWALCNGQVLGINQNSALFSLIGTSYGGDGMRTFKLPDLQGQVPMHFGDGFNLATRYGEPSHALSIPEMPAHNHLMTASATTGSAQVPVPSLSLAQAQTAATDKAAVNVYGAPSQTLAAFGPSAIGMSGNGQGHENRQPYLVLNFCMAMQGVFPSRN